MAKQNPNNIEKKTCPKCGKLIGISGYKNHLNQHELGLIKPKNRSYVKITDSIKNINSDKGKSIPEIIHLIDRKKSTLKPLVKKTQVKIKKKIVPNKNLKIATTLEEKKKLNTVTLLDPEKIQKIKFSIDSIEFHDGTFKIDDYQYEKANDKDFRKEYNDLKEDYKRHVSGSVVLEIVGTKNIRPSNTLYTMTNYFDEIYKKKYTKKCPKCNLYIANEKYEHHRKECNVDSEQPKVKIEPTPEKIYIKKPEDYLPKTKKQNKQEDEKSKEKGRKNKRGGLLDICKSIQEQSYFEKKCQYKTIGRLQSKTLDNSYKVFWVYNDIPKNTVIKNDMHGHPISIIIDPKISKVISGTPISKNHKIVYNLIASGKAKNNTGKKDLIILNKASYFNASDGKTKGVKIQSRITKDPVLWANLENLILQIEEINNHGVKLKESELIQKLLDIVKGASTEELFADIKPFIRRSLELRGLGYLETDQEDIKRIHIYDNVTLVIDGGPGTGKTTTLVQRIRFLTSPSALLSYEVFKDENDPTYKSLINTGNQNWIFYSPSQLLADYLKSNMEAEGLETGPNYVKVWNEHLDTIVKDYFEKLKIKETNYYKQEFYNEIIDGFNTYVCQNLIKRLFTDNRNFVFETPEIKTLFQRIENYKAKINIDESLAVIERGFTGILQNYKEDIEKIIKKRKMIYNDEISNILRNIIDKQRIILEVEIEKGSINKDGEKVTIEKVVEGIFKKKISKLTGKKVKFNELQKAIDAILNIEVDEKNATYINESQIFEELYKDYSKNFDSLYLKSIFKIYQQFREGAEVKEMRLDKNAKLWGKDELAFLVSEINEYIINKKLVSIKEEYVNSYQQYAKNIIAVDEASDLNLFDLKCIYSFRHWEKNSVTFCGDILQRITNDGIKNWDDLKSIIEYIDVIKLKISYRQSPTLLDLARKIYKHVTQNDADYKPYLSKHSSEPKPLMFINRDENTRLKWVLERLNEVYRAYGNSMPSTAIFVISNNKIEGIAKKINTINNNSNLTIEAYNKSVDLNKKENTVIIFPIDEIKGLEFEAVMFVDLNEILQTNLDDELLLRYIYIGLSRAAYYFGISGSEKFSGGLKFLNSAFNEKGTWN